MKITGVITSRELSCGGWSLAWGEMGEGVGYLPYVKNKSAIRQRRLSGIQSGY
jgi:hypothetical protein